VGAGARFRVRSSHARAHSHRLLPRSRSPRLRRTALEMKRSRGARSRLRASLVIADWRLLSSLSPLSLAPPRASRAGSPSRPQVRPSGTDSSLTPLSGGLSPIGEPRRRERSTRRSTSRPTYHRDGRRRAPSRPHTSLRTLCLMHAHQHATDPARPRAAHPMK